MSLHISDMQIKPQCDTNRYTPTRVVKMKLGPRMPSVDGNGEHLAVLCIPGWNVS